jgi:hypothetical protein
MRKRQRLTYELTSNFARIRNEKARQHIVGLVRSVADTEPAGKRSAAH